MRCVVCVAWEGMHVCTRQGKDQKQQILMGNRRCEEYAILWLKKVFSIFLEPVGEDYSFFFCMRKTKQRELEGAR